MIWSWGYGGSHQIGDGRTSGDLSRHRPVRVTEPGFARKVATPYATGTNPGQHPWPVTVGFTSYTAAAAIHYTTDATEPTTGSPLYSAPFPVAQDTTFKVKAFKSGLAASNTETLAYTILAATPTFTPGGGTYTTPQNVTISTSSPGAVVRYTTDGTSPTAASTAFTAPLAVSVNTNFKAKAFHPSMVVSSEAYANYNFNFPAGSAPVFTPGAGTHVGSVTVTISGPAGATFRYTTDGSEPTAASPAYSAPLAFSATTTLKAKSYQTGQAPSATTSGAYTIELTAPTLSPSGGAITAGQAVTLNHADPGATIRYTINGVDPGPTDASTTPGSSVTILANVTLKARAYKTGNAPSAVVSGTFTISGTAGAAGAITAGYAHTLVAKPDGTVWAWGRNVWGKLGDGSSTDRLSPVPISSLSGITGLGAGFNHSVARKSDGTPWTTGYNSAGQLGNGTNNNQSTFTGLAKPGGVDVIAVAAGDNHTLALGSDGRVWAWGLNSYGQLGNGNNTTQYAPVPVSGLTSVQAIAAGDDFSVALTSTGAVWAWGYNTEGALGNGGTTHSNVPVQVTTVSTTNLGGVVAIAAGQRHALARKSDGTVWSWGMNSEGQLGSGAIGSPRTRADQVVQLSQVRAIGAGRQHSLAVKEDGSVWAWGSGGHGQLGNNSGATQPAPVQAIGISGIDSVAGGGLFSVALGLDGSVWSWGGNQWGELGDGTTVGRSTPGRVADPGFTWRVATPSFNPWQGGLSAPQDITLACATSGASIHYTTNGADPTPADPSVPSGGTVWVDVSITLKARAYKPDWTPSAVNSIAYEMTLPAPTFTPAQGTYHVPRDVTITHAIPGAIIRYTTNGSPVLPTSPSLVSGGSIFAAQTTTVKAGLFRSSTMGVGGGGGGGGVAVGPTGQAIYTMKAGQPAHILAGGGGGGTPVSIGASSVTPGASIWAARGASPLGSSTESGPSGAVFGISKSTTLRTRARRAGLWLPSDPQSSSHFIFRGPASTPGFSLGPVTSAGRFLSMSSPTTGSVVRYTLDGTEPSFRSLRYHGPVRVWPNQTFRARAFGVDYAPSTVTPAFPTGSWGLGESGDPAEPPTFEPPGGSYATTRAVTLTSATPDATMHYTTDGSDPTTSSSTVPSGGVVTVTRGLPLKAIAVASGTSASRVTRADYRITGAVVVGIWDSYNNKQSAMALKTDGTVWGWGHNAYGELGIGAGGVQNAPVQVPGLNARAITLGQSHGLAVKSDGTVWSWGQNNQGQLGDGTTTAHLTPAIVPGLSQAVAVAAGVWTSYALTSDGQVYSWGYNGHGQLGNAGATQYRPTPAALGLTDVVAIAAGSSHALALRKDGTVWAWGYNWHGSIGDGTVFTTRPTPVQVSGLTGVTAISAGGLQSLAIKSDGQRNGQVWAWGYNENNTLGDDLGVDQPVPVHVLDDARWVGAADNQVSFYLKAGVGGVSAVWGSGNHRANQVLTSGASSTAIPTPVLHGSVVSVAGGYWHIVALRTDGTLRHWTNAAVNGFALGDAAWANTDHDGDGLRTAQEWDIETDPWNADSNGDGILDGAAVSMGADPMATDVDADGLANVLERSMGTDPYRADTDGDGHPDGADAYPLDPTRWEGPPPNGGDTTAPLVTLTEPTSATLVSVVPAP